MGALVALALFENRTALMPLAIGFLKDKAYVGMTLVFFVYLLSGINSEDASEWLKQVRIKLPFLLLPFAFYGLRPLRTLHHKKLHLGLGLVGLVSAIPVLLYYLGHQHDVIQAIGKGQYMPTPIDHIHYSIILSYASLALLLLLADSCIHKSKIEQLVMWFVSGLLAVFLHLLAVRSGLVIFYLGLAFVSTWYIYSSKKYLMGGIGLLAVVLAPIVMYKSVPTLHKKINYMIYDFNQFQKGQGKNYSDSERLMSYHIAYELAKESPIIGHGVGDLKSLMISKHKAKYGEKQKYIFPHNQYLYVLSGVGFLGFIFFFGGLLSPLIFSKPDPYVWLIFIAMLTSFMVENTVQRAVSIAFFLFFICWNIGRRSEYICTANE